MAGLLLIGVPICGGLVGGTVLQVAMRTSELTLFQRVEVELALMGVGALAIYCKPPFKKGLDGWLMFLFYGSMVTTGGFAMAEGFIMNIVPGGMATVLKALGLLLVACLAYCYQRKLEVDRREVAFRPPERTERAAYQPV